MKKIIIPKGILHTDEDEAARKRRELREKLLRGEEVKVTPQGHVKGTLHNSERGIIIPPGKLAGFYWYERDPELFRSEKEAMRRYFPQFELRRFDDGRLSWVGEIQTDLRPSGAWHLQAIYENNHPDNSTYGGSIRIYSIHPDLEELQDRLDESIPHILRDPGGYIYICTARAEDFQAGDTISSAASALSWAAKWIAAFELWMNGDLSTWEFCGHHI